MIKINFNDLIYDSLIPQMRNFVNFQWIQTLIKPISYNYDLFTGYTYDCDFELKHNSQVLSFEHYLNTHVPFTFSGGTSRPVTYTGVTIGNGVWLTDQYFRWDDEPRYEPRYFRLDTEEEYVPIYFRLYEEFFDDTYDFVVYYHTECLTANPDYLNQLTIYIDKLRQAGSTYYFEAL